ncbi:MAG: patatin-like phospholipase family protein [Polyangiaceae bacterium]
MRSPKEDPETGAAPTLRAWLAEGPFALAMSSGFFSFFAHAGFLAALEREGLRPSRTSGSSAGALVTGLWAGGMQSAHIADELTRLERRDFWDPAPGAGLLAGRLFRARIRELVSGRTFEQCRVPAAVSVFDVRARMTRVRARGDLADAICASCAFPGLFHPVRIEGRAYLDGGVADRPGLAGMPPDAPRVLFHHIASRSPWRRTPPAPPTRPGMLTVVLDDLPRSGPFKLDQGRRALEIARDKALVALDRPVTDGVLRV